MELTKLRTLDYIKEIKTASNRGMKDKEMIVNYIMNQKQHHTKESFEEEYKRLLEENGIKWEERYIF